jgi:hypothetical protein
MGFCATGNGKGTKTNAIVSEIEAIARHLGRALDHVTNFRRRPAKHAIKAGVSCDKVMIWVDHDTVPNALSAKIKRYMQAQSWCQDLALVEA